MRPRTLVAISFSIATGLSFPAAIGCRTESKTDDSASRLTMSFLADFALPAGTGEASEVGGLSAVSYQPASGRWVALSDARVGSRFYELTVEIAGTALRVVPGEATPLTTADGEPFGPDVLDPEGLGRLPWGNLVVSTEPDTRHDPVEQAKLLEVDLAGRLVRFVDVPEEFKVSGAPPDHGLRHNLGFEALSLSPDGARLFVGAEATLVQDGPAADFEHAGFCRILAYRVDAATHELAPDAEYVYPIGAFAREPGFGEREEVSGGLVELVALSSRRLLSLERIFIRQLEGEKRDLSRAHVYRIDLDEATNVRDVPSLRDRPDFRPVRKELVLDLDDILPALSRDYPKLDNLEAMGLGPELPGGGRALLLLSDDNFRETQRTQFLLFRLKGM